VHDPGENCPDYDPSFRWRALPDQATEHNVRSHAHTRAFNRAVSNLCGFGEVSAEEMTREDIIEAETVQSEGHPATRNEPPSEQDQRQGNAQARTGRTNAGSGSGATISTAQARRFFALAMKAGWKAEDLGPALKEVYGFERSEQITMAKYNAIIDWVQQGPPK
jgi:hypothetical protein